MSEGEGLIIKMVTFGVWIFRHQFLATMQKEYKTQCRHVRMCGACIGFYRVC